MHNLQNQVIVVTGASRGIGEACARTLANRGARVMLAARNQAKIEAIATEIRANGETALSQACDVTNFDQVQALVKLAHDTFGRLDALVNNAGAIEPIARISNSDPSAWADVVDINYKGVFHGMRAAIPLMLSQRSGTIVNMSSGAANSALEGWSHYCSSKAAVKKLTECAHKEVGDQGICVVGLSPGTVATNMMAQIKTSGINPVSQLDWDSHISPESAAQAVAFLCTPAAREFAGTDFSLNTAGARELVGLSLTD